MSESFVESLNIHTVKQVERGHLALDITFYIDDIYYVLDVSKNKNGKFSPNNFWHDFPGRFIDCPFCRFANSNRNCLELDKFKNQVFRRLITYPSIRLFWIYLEYE